MQRVRKAGAAAASGGSSPSAAAAAGSPKLHVADPQAAQPASPLHRGGKRPAPLTNTHVRQQGTSPHGRERVLAHNRSINLERCNNDGGRFGGGIGLSSGGGGILVGSPAGAGQQAEGARMAKELQQRRDARTTAEFQSMLFKVRTSPEAREERRAQLHETLEDARVWRLLQRTQAAEAAAPEEEEEAAAAEEEAAAAAPEEGEDDEATAE
jgi:hypothetical protein